MINGTLQWTSQNRNMGLSIGFSHYIMKTSGFHMCGVYDLEEWSFSESQQNIILCLIVVQGQQLGWLWKQLLWRWSEQLRVEWHWGNTVDGIKGRGEMTFTGEMNDEDLNKTLGSSKKNWDSETLRGRHNWLMKWLQFQRHGCVQDNG